MLSSYLQKIRYRRCFAHRLTTIVRGQRSYSQHQEDLVAEYLLGKVERFIDIGANDGISGSSTFIFAEQGAESLYFESVKAYYAVAKKPNKNFPKVRILQEGISNAEGTVPIHVQGYLGQTSSLFAELEHAGPRITESAKVRRLSYWSDLYAQYTYVDLVSIDAQRTKSEVLKGIDYSRMACRCFIKKTATMPVSAPGMTMKPSGSMSVLHNATNTFSMQECDIGSVDGKAMLEQFPEQKSLIAKMIN